MILIVVAIVFGAIYVLGWFLSFLFMWVVSKFGPNNRPMGDMLQSMVLALAWPYLLGGLAWYNWKDSRDQTLGKTKK